MVGTDVNHARGKQEKHGQCRQRKQADNAGWSQPYQDSVPSVALAPQQFSWTPSMSQCSVPMIKTWKGIHFDTSYARATHKPLSPFLRLSQIDISTRSSTISTVHRPPSMDNLPVPSRNSDRGMPQRLLLEPEIEFLTFDLNSFVCSSNFSHKTQPVSSTSLFLSFPLSHEKPHPTLLYSIYLSQTQHNHRNNPLFFYPSNKAQASQQSSI